MRATVKDVYSAVTVKNAVIFATIVATSIFLIEVLGYIIWRRFPVPSLIILVASLGWKIGRKIGHEGLSRILNAASVGLGVFGAALFCAAIIDGTLFPTFGYVSWSVQMTLWAWIAFHVLRAWRILKKMPPDHLTHVTEGTASIYAQMTYREARAQDALDAYHEATKHNFAVIP
jgi:hypothetical protein